MLGFVWKSQMPGIAPLGEVRCALVLRLFEFIATFLARLPAKFVFTIKNQDSCLGAIGAYV